MGSEEATRRIVLLADGTGNAFSTQASNIWRLYGSLDLSDPDQVVHYIKGVGTAGFRPVAILDGATGFGVPGNVRELYRFLCHTWHPGSEVYLFGFSRGAFTIRTLIGLVASQGLMPTEVDGRPVGRAELRRIAMAAWRAYRAEAAPAGHVWPTVTATRAVRDALLWLWTRLRRHRPYAVFQRARDDQGRRSVELAFAGLFDTVEAYGVPFEGLRAAVDRTIWPISFRNRVLSPTVRQARHALSLDDERVAFHPVRFDQSAEARSLVPPRIREVWFAGVHSDVGGGYPDDALAHVPLLWMIGEATAAAAPGRAAIRWREGTAEGIAAAAAPLATTHDSRTGLASLYRYGPRVISDDDASGGSPIVHHAVPEKMVFGPDDYAPLTLPSAARVLMPDGELRPIQGFAAALDVPDRMAQPSAAEQAVARLARPNAGFVALARDRIWLRELAGSALLVAAALALCLATVAPWLDRAVTAVLAAAGTVTGLDGIASFFQTRIEHTRGGLGANLTDLQAAFGGLVPGYAKGWVQALVDQPLAAAVVIGVAVALYRTNGLLRDRIADAAHCAWFIDADGGGAAQAPSSWATRFAHRMRGSTGLSAARRFVATRLMPVVMLVLTLAAGLLLVDRAAITYASGSGAFCKMGQEAVLQRQPKAGQSNLAIGFTVDQLCWGSGIWLEKGRTYRLWLDSVDPLLDGDAVAPVEGYTDGGWGKWLLLPLRRWWGAAWFQPIARIGWTGPAEWPLASSEGIRAQPLPMETRLTGAPASGTAPSSPNPETGPLRQGFVSQFTAPATGELFIFVNDAVLAPFGALAHSFYRDNRGRTNVTVELVPAPTPPPGQDYDFSANLAPP